DLRSCILNRTGKAGGLAMRIEKSKFINVNLEGFDFSDVMMSNNTFENSNLKNTKWSGANVGESTFINTNLEGATYLTDGRPFVMSKFINVNMTHEFKNDVCGDYAGNKCSKVRLVADSRLPEISKKPTTSNKSFQKQVLNSKNEIKLQAQIDNGDKATAIKFSNSNNIFAVGYKNGALSIWNTSASKIISNMDSKHDYSVKKIIFTEQNNTIISTDGFSIKEWNSYNGHLLRTIFESPPNECDTSLSADLIQDFEEIYQTPDYTHDWTYIEISNDGKYAAFFDYKKNALAGLQTPECKGYKKKLKIINLITGEIIQEIYIEALKNMKISPNSKFLLVSTSSTHTLTGAKFKLYDLIKGKIKREFKMDNVFNYEFSPDSKNLLIRRRIGNNHSFV
ncbi:uncharacterized protein METZ01_LOCUS292781, partial [marine metagenome]